MTTTAVPTGSAILAAVEAAFDSVEDVLDNFSYHTYLHRVEPTIPVVTTDGISVAFEVEGDPEGHLYLFTATDASGAHLAHGEVVARDVYFA